MDNIENVQLIKRLFEAGTCGLALSPGDELAWEAMCEIKRLREGIDMLRETLEYGLRDDGLLPRITSEYRKRIYTILKQT